MRAIETISMIKHVAREGEVRNKVLEELKKETSVGTYA
jgi:hypothetical protein